MTINVHYYDDVLEEYTIGPRSIFLAGPTLRTDQRTPWRLRAIDRIFLTWPLSRNLDLLIPEFSDGQFSQRAHRRFGATYPPVAWEANGISRAGVLLFWMPFDTVHLGLTTRAEVAAAIAQSERTGPTMGRVVLGMPPATESASYVRYHASLAGLPVHTTLEATVDAAVAWFGDSSW